MRRIRVRDFTLHAEALAARLGVPHSQLDASLLPSRDLRQDPAVVDDASVPRFHRGQQVSQILAGATVAPASSRVTLARPTAGPGLIGPVRRGAGTSMDMHPSGPPRRAPYGRCPPSPPTRRGLRGEADPGEVHARPHALRHQGRVGRRLAGQRHHDPSRGLRALPPEGVLSVGLQDRVPTVQRGIDGLGVPQPRFARKRADHVPGRLHLRPDMRLRRGQGRRADIQQIVLQFADVLLPQRRVMNQIHGPSRCPGATVPIAVACSASALPRSAIKSSSPGARTSSDCTFPPYHGAL